MNVQEIREIAKKHAVKTGKLRKGQMIQAIQLAEGNTPCFGTDKEKSCDQTQCLWLTDCIVESQKR